MKERIESEVALPPKCPVCNKKTGKHVTIKMESHHKEAWWKCSSCEAVWGFKDNNKKMEIWVNAEGNDPVV